jgi:hypothetical protein
MPVGPSPFGSLPAPAQQQLTIALPLQPNDLQRLTAALAATDHCGGLRSLRVTRVELIENPLLWHAYASKCSELRLRAMHAGDAIAPLPCPLLNSKNQAALDDPRCQCVLDSALLSRRLHEAMPNVFPRLTASQPCLNELFLLHGTPNTTTALGIARDGFDPRLASATGNLFGAGTYLTNTLCKAHMYTQERPKSPTPAPQATTSAPPVSPRYADRHGRRATANATPPPAEDRIIIVARAVLGCALITEKAMPTLRRPPERIVPQPLRGSHGGHGGGGASYVGLYDSVVGNGKDHKEFVVYDRASVYPFALVHYHATEPATGSGLP